MTDIDRIVEAMTGAARKSVEEELRERYAKCEEDGGHVFEVVHAPPYRCTFCGFSHTETDGGKFIRATNK
jgi:predicted Zn-ribbon and HTH transcriptional regulator